MIKAVLFDYGGVLTNGGRSVKHDIAERLGIAEEDLNFEDVNDKFRRGLISSDEFFGTLEERHNGDGTLKDKLLNSNDEFYQKEQSVYDLAEQLRQLGIKTAVFSNVYKPSADKLRERGLYDGFDTVILSCEEHYAKPDTEFYQRAMDLLSLPAEEILLIDDQDKCIIKAQELGMKTIKSVTSDQVVRDAKKLFESENNISL